MTRPKKVDKHVVDNIVRFGGDLEEERPVDFFFYFPSEYAATQVEIKLINLGFNTNVKYFDYNSNWLLRAVKTMRVSTDRIYELSLWLTKVAEEQGGEYDGWGAPI